VVKGILLQLFALLSVPLSFSHSCSDFLSRWSLIASGSRAPIASSANWPTQPMWPSRPTWAMPTFVHLTSPRAPPPPRALCHRTGPSPTSAPWENSQRSTLPSIPHLNSVAPPPLRVEKCGHNATHSLPSYLTECHLPHRPSLTLPKLVRYHRQAPFPPQLHHRRLATTLPPEH
jgi:hypothetical protein